MDNAPFSTANHLGPAWSAIWVYDVCGLPMLVALVALLGRALWCWSRSSWSASHRTAEALFHVRWLLVTMVVGSVSHVILLGGYHQRVRWGIVMEGEITRLSIWRGSHVRSGTYRTVYAVLSNEERVQVGADASTFTALTEGQRVPFLVEGDPIRTVQIGAKPTVSISALLGALILQGALLLLYRRAHSRRADNLIR